MDLRDGIPSVAEVDALESQPFYRALREWNLAFSQDYGRLMPGVGGKWTSDRFNHWSRRWEFPWAAARLTALRGQPPLRILDAGSGITFFPFWLADHIEGSEIHACDGEAKFAAMFDAVNAARGRNKVRFFRAFLQDLPLPDSHFDAIYCISVLEHTGRYGEVVREFARVLKPGGRLVLTFDISLDGKFGPSVDESLRLIEAVGERFDLPAGLDARAEMSRLDREGDALTTVYLRKHRPHLLPWRYPLLKGVHDLLHGHGWTGGFHPLSVFCLEGRAKKP